MKRYIYSKTVVVVVVVIIQAWQFWRGQINYKNNYKFIDFCFWLKDGLQQYEVGWEEWLDCLSLSVSAGQTKLRKKLIACFIAEVMCM
jgi:hypothetical protein